MARAFFEHTLQSEHNTLDSFSLVLNWMIINVINCAAADAVDIDFSIYILFSIKLMLFTLWHWLWVANFETQKNEKYRTTLRYGMSSPYLSLWPSHLIFRLERINLMVDIWSIYWDDSSKYWSHRKTPSIIKIGWRLVGLNTLHTHSLSHTQKGRHRHACK